MHIKTAKAKDFYKLPMQEFRTSISSPKVNAVIGRIVREEYFL